jgi:hypothetical protein
MFHVTCEDGAAPERYARRWVAVVQSQSQSVGSSYNYIHYALPLSPTNHMRTDQHPYYGFYKQQIDAAKGPTFGARFTLSTGGQSPVPGSVCNDMIIDLDTKHGVARFVSFYDHISAQERRVCAFMPHRAKQGIFQKTTLNC